MPLEIIADGVWGVADVIALPGGARLPLRMTVVQLGDGGLWLHAPVRLDDATAAELEALGPVRYLVVPNLQHHVHLAAACERFADASVFAPEGLALKRPDLHIDEVLTERTPDPWRGQVQPFPLDGASAIQEVVFLHRPTKTLLVTDLVFHVRSGSWPTQLLLRTVGCWDRLASSRAWRWRYVQDPQAFAETCQHITALDIERLVPAHGEVVTEDARARLGAVLAPWCMRA